MSISYWKHHRINENKLEEKQCTKCLDWLEMNDSNFMIDNKNKDGFTSKCRCCQKKYNESYYLATREKQLEKARERDRKLTEEERLIKNKKSMEYYYEHGEKYYINRKTYHEEHEEILTEKEDEWTEKNRIKLREYVRDRNQHKYHKISEQERLDCIKYFNNSCAYCNISEDEHKKKYNERLHKDHAYNDGNNFVTNCVPGCKSCNSKKKKKDFNEWYTPDNPRFEEGFYKQENYDRIVKWLEDDCFKYLDPKHKLNNT